MNSEPVFAGQDCQAENRSSSPAKECALNFLTAQKSFFNLPRDSFTKKSIPPLSHLASQPLVLTGRFPDFMLFAPLHHEKELLRDTQPSDKHWRSPFTLSFIVTPPNRRQHHSADIAAGSAKSGRVVARFFPSLLMPTCCFLSSTQIVSLPRR